MANRLRYLALRAIQELELAPEDAKVYKLIGANPNKTRSCGGEEQCQ